MSTVNHKRAVPPHTADAQTRIPRFRSTELFHGGRRIIIKHGGADYCLMVTRNARLILIKN